MLCLMKLVWRLKVSMHMLGITCGSFTQHYHGRLKECVSYAYGTARKVTVLVVQKICTIRFQSTLVRYTYSTPMNFLKNKIDHNFNRKAHQPFLNKSCYYTQYAWF